MGKAETLARLDAAIDQMRALERQLGDRAISGRPVRVALVGLPNAGKSSLFNALSSGKAIVSPIPGTTRDYLMKSLTLGGIEVELIDTAGWQDSGDTIERQAQQFGSDAAARSDVVLWCDERGEFDESDANRLNATGAEVIRVRTKADLSSGATPQAISTSAITAGGTDLLQAALAECLAAIVRPALAPSQSRCRHHVVACANHLRAARDHVAAHDPPELAASAHTSSPRSTGRTHGRGLHQRLARSHLLTLLHWKMNRQEMGQERKLPCTTGLHSDRSQSASLGRRWHSEQKHGKAWARGTRAQVRVAL